MASKVNGNKILESANSFKLDGVVISAVPFGSGHINDTFKVITDSENKQHYLFQKINHLIFQDVKALMSNIAAVCTHLKEKYAHLGENEVLKRTMTIIPTKSGDLYYQDESGDYWRMFILIQETKSYDVLETEDQAYSGGLAFGQFQKHLADMDATMLIEILPNFHNIEYRLHNLKEAVRKDPLGRVATVKDILDYIFERESKMRTILESGRKGELPLRITHNDTKFNNVLLDQDDNVQCVIDLDTVMPGYVAYDFGDAIRTIINSAAEDEADTDKIVLNIALFRAYTEGYLQEAKDFLTNKEVESLIHGVHLLPYMQAVRFLTDYIEGDHYYKIKYNDHNLVRTKAQLKLVSELEKHQEELEDIISETVSL